MDVDIATLKANIAAREGVKTLLSLVPDILKDSAIKEDRFWEILAQEAAAKVGKVLVEDGPVFRMSEQEAVRFEHQHFPFGKYKGQKVGGVDYSYILLITEGDFTKELIRYSRSDRFKDRE